MSRLVPMLTGKIRSLNTDNGFGFIAPATGGADLFFHCSAVDVDFAELKLEQSVQYVPDQAAAKPRAKQVFSHAQHRRSSRPAGSRGVGSRSRSEASSREHRSAGDQSAAGRSTPRGSRRDGRSARPKSSKRTPRPEIEYTFGYVTKLPRKQPIGFISSVQGGHEYYFEPEDVRGKKKFSLLAVGDYVRFVARSNAENPKQPLANKVEVVAKPINRQENNLARHPKARRKKPTWKS